MNNKIAPLGTCTASSLHSDDMADLLIRLEGLNDNDLFSIDTLSKLWKDVRNDFCNVLGLDKQKHNVVFVPSGTDSESLISSVILEKDGRPYVNLNPTYYPLYKVIPVYPRKARNKKLGGYVVTSFTIQKNGSVKNIKVIEGFCSSAKYEYGKFEETYECDLFNKSAIKATKKLSYPKQDQAINNAEHRFTFVFE